MTLDEILASGRPVEPPTREALDWGRADAVSLAHAEISQRAYLLRRRTRRRVLGGAALIAAAAGAFLVVPRTDEPSQPIVVAPLPTASPVVKVDYKNASEVLHTTAAAAGAQSAPVNDAPYWKVTTQYGSDASTRSTRWIGIDGPGVMPFDENSNRPGGNELFDRLPRATIRLDGRTYTWRELNDGALPADQLPRLLTESELKHQHTDPDRAVHEYYFFKEAYEVLARTPASPAIREALWDAVADIKGVELDGEVTDALGRTGWAVSLRGIGQGTQTYIVDPTNGSLLETRGHAEGRRPADGWIETFVESGPTKSAPRPSTKAEILRYLTRNDD